MTENKRFECMGNGYFVDNLEDADLDNREVVDILNHLHEENEFLKIKNEKTQEYLRQKDKRISDLVTKKEDAEYELLHLKEMYEELLEENEQLKKQVSRVEALQILRKLEEENEQLKQRIEDYNKALKTLQDVYERKDRQLQRAKKDTRKYTDYFMNELNWDCDRIIEEVFR